MIPFSIKQFIVLLLAAWTLQASAQTVDTRKFIEVTGSAEMTIPPDEMVLQVVLGNYSNNKASLDKIEEKFYALLKDNEIPKEAVELESSQHNYGWWYWWNYHESQSKTLRVRLSNKTNFMKLARDLHVEWVHSANIISSTNKDTQRLRKEVKKEAVKAAKEKATYLLESVGEQLGGVLSIEEVPETSAQQPYWYRPNLSSMTSNSVMSNASSNDTAIDNGQEIKLRYEVKVKFEIK